MELIQPGTRQGSKSLWLLTNSRIQSRYPQVGKLSLKPRETEHSNPLSLSPLHVKWMRGGISWHEKCLFSGSNHTGSQMIKALWQSSKFLVVCLWEKRGGWGGGLSTRAGLLHSAVFAEINPAFPVVPDSRRCLCQLSAMPLCSILLAVCCRDCCPTLSTQPLVFLTIPARTAGTAVLWVPTAF